MKKILKSCFVVIVALSLVFTACPIAKAATVLKSGSAGVRATWTIYDDGRLVISGTGRLKGYNDGDNIPYACNEAYGVNEIVIEEGITIIGLQAFSINLTVFDYFKNIKTLTLPSSLQSIERGAFGGLKLDRVNINSLSQWLSLDFADYSANPCEGAEMCTELYVKGVKLTELIIPNSIKKIKNYAFMGCASIETVKIHDQVTSIGKFAFNSCSGLKDLYFYGNAPTFGESMFILSNVTIHYPQSNTTWTDAAKKSASIPQGLGGSVTFKTHNLKVSNSSVYKPPVVSDVVPSTTSKKMQSNKEISSEVSSEISSVEAVSSEITATQNSTSSKLNENAPKTINPLLIILPIVAVVVIAAVILVIIFNKKKSK